jgi:hypothetical protein
MENKPTKQQKRAALAYQIKEDLNNLTIELEQRIKNIKILTDELIKSL